MIKLIGIAVLVNMFVWWFEPLQRVKEWLRWHKLTDKVIYLACTKCMGFWIGLVITKNLYQAAVISFLSFVIEWILDYINDWKNN